MKQLAFASIQTLQKKLRSKEITPQDILTHTLERFKKYDQKIGSTLEVFSAAMLEADLEKNNPINSVDKPLAGIPGLIKDNICQKGQITACASKMLSNFVAPYDATVTKHIKAAGSYSVGRANCDEFAMGSSTETSAFQKTKNPWDLSCVPGGSSGGSAAAVAAGLVPWAFGSETGGSVRQPAALCGIVGLKPTYGLLSRYGLVAYASSLDAVGIFTRTVYDNALVLSEVAGPDDQDSTVLRGLEKIDYTKNLSGTLRPGTKIGVIDNMMGAEGIDPQVRTCLEEAIKAFEKLGATIVPVQLPMIDHGAAVYFMISRAEAASNLARYDGVRYGFRAPGAESLGDMYNETRLDGFGHEVRRRILIGNYVLSSGHADQYYKSAKTVQNMIRQEFMSSFTDVDMLFAPVSPTTAFKFDAFADNSLAMDLQDYFTASVNLAGLPAVAVPCGFVQNMPVGFQLIGPHLSEAAILQAAYAYEQAHDWVDMHPEWLQ